MSFTEKQQQNGADQGVGSENSAVPSADITGHVSGLISQAQAVGATYSGYGHTIMTGQTGQTSDLTLGNTWDWDDGLAVAEEPGEM